MGPVYFLLGFWTIHWQPLKTIHSIRTRVHQFKRLGIHLQSEPRCYFESQYQFSSHCIGIQLAKLDATLPCSITLSNYFSNWSSLVMWDDISITLSSDWWALSTMIKRDTRARRNWCFSIASVSIFVVPAKHQPPPRRCVIRAAVF